MPVTARTVAIPLTEADIPQLRLPGRRSNEQTRDTLRSWPGRSVWVPGTLEHLLIGSWRNRREISSIANQLGRENVMIGTDCGFAQGPFARRVHPSIQWAKLRSLAEGARLASRELWP